MKTFKHVTAETVDDAVKILEESKGKAKVIGGGTDLLGALKNEVYGNFPETIIDIKAISNLSYIKKDSSGLRIGGLTKLNDVVNSSVIRENCSVLAEASRSIGSPQIRNMATIGGNLCQDVRCWFYRASPFIGEPYECLRKGGKRCYALTTENQYHSIFGAAKSEDPPCSTGCPGGIDIPLYLSKIREGDLPAAAHILLASNPMPAITGRVCPHFCEQGCVRNDFDEAVSIRSIERYIGDYVLDHANEFIKPVNAPTGKKVAVVGSGPAGLATAHYLVMSGHRVTVFDRLEEAGGMLFYGIPDYILPNDIVRKSVKAIKNAGVEFQLGVDIGRDILMEDLQKEFDSLFLGTGAWGRPMIGIEGEALTKPALSFLTDVNRGLKESPGKKVLVIGGGNVAVDAAITASRLGAEEITMICLESEEEMPAFPWEIEKALEEGVHLMPSWGPYRVVESGGKVGGIELVRCTSVFNEDGLFAPTYDDKSKKSIEADHIIMAVGQKTDLSFLGTKVSLRTDRDLIVVDKAYQRTNVPGIFAGGDITSPPASVIEAVAAGRKAAAAMNFYLNGPERQPKVKSEMNKGMFLTFSKDCFQRKKRVGERMHPPSQRRVDLEDTQGLEIEELEVEAKRCFNCGCVAVSPSDVATVLIALDAKLHITGSNGARNMSIEDFFTLSGNNLQADEIVTEIHIPPPEDGAKQAFLKFRLRHALDFAIASVAANITQGDGICKDARIVLGAVAPIPLRASHAERAIKGKVIDATTAKSAAEAALADAVPLSENGYKTEITKTLVQRAILSCNGDGA